MESRVLKENWREVPGIEMKRISNRVTFRC